MTDQNRRTLSHVAGCLLGGAVGDALGAPVEFLTLKQIIKTFGQDGITDYAPAYGRIGAITDDTQMTLFTVEGLVISQVRTGRIDPEQIPLFVYHAYLRWLATQNRGASDQLIHQHGTCAIVDGQLAMIPELNSRRAPGNSCLSSLMNGRMGTCTAPINDSKGCGGVMRIAPVGYFVNPEDVFDTACDIAAITHGHPAGYLAAGCLAQIICDISLGKNLLEAVEKALEILQRKTNHQECLNAVNQALIAAENSPVSADTLVSLGEGWIAEEALAMSLYCALIAGDDFEKAVCLAVNHGGDSDSTGAITGNILGALYGREVIPQKYLENLELLEVIEEMAGDLFERMIRIP